MLNKNNKIFILLSTAIFLVLPFVASAGLSCSVYSICSSSDVEIMDMSDSINAHSALPGYGYPQKVCCSGIAGLSNSCSGNFLVVAKLSGPSNAHARINSMSDYPGSNNVCISAPVGDTLTVAYKAGDCAGYDTTMFSMSKPDTNSHVGNVGSYANKVCASVFVPAAPVILPSISSSAHLQSFVAQSSPEDSEEEQSGVSERPRSFLSSIFSRVNQQQQNSFITSNLGASAVSAVENSSSILNLDVSNSTKDESKSIDISGTASSLSGWNYLPSKPAFWALSLSALALVFLGLRKIVLYASRKKEKEKFYSDFT